VISLRTEANEPDPSVVFVGSLPAAVTVTRPPLVDALEVPAIRPDVPNHDDSEKFFSTYAPELDAALAVALNVRAPTTSARNTKE